MTNKEINIRSIIFLIIGILLVLSLVICIYIVNSQKDLKTVEAIVTNVKEDKDGTGKNDVTVVYNVDGTSYKYNFYYRDDVKVDDKLNIYYHAKTPNEVQAYRVSKYIFVCPLVGLVLCIYGLLELFHKSHDRDDSDADVETKLVSEDEKTQQFKIIPDDTIEHQYDKDEAEKEEVPIKEIRSKDYEEDPDGNRKKKVIPKDYHISGSVIVYEQLGDKTAEVSFKDVRSIVRTVNSQEELVKLTVYTDKIACVLTSKRDESLESVANTIHNKMIVLDPNFEEIEENKEF